MSRSSGGDRIDATGHRSLAAQLTWLSILVVALTVLAVGAGLIFIAAQHQRESAYRLQQKSADQVSQLISSYIIGSASRLRFFLGSTSLATLAPEQRLRNLESLLLNSMPLFSQVTFLDRDGNEKEKVSRFHTFLPNELMNQADSAAFSTAIKGDMYIGPVSFLANTGLLSVLVAMPAKSSAAETAGVVIAAVNVNYLWEEVSNIKIGRTGYAYLVDMNGKFVAYQKLAKVLQRHGEDMRRMPPVSYFVAHAQDSIGPAHEYVGLIGEEVVGVYAPIRGTGWAVVIEQPTREAYASIVKMEMYLLALALIGIITAGTLGFIIARRLIGPIRALTTAAQQFGAGDLETEFVGVKRQDEVGILSNAFQVMQKRLHDLYEGLKRKLAELEAMQKALHESEEKYRSIFENATEGIYQTTPDGRYLSVNPAMCAIFGYDSPKAMMDSVKDISSQHYVNPAGRSRLQKALEEKGAVEGFEEELLRTDGTKIICSLNAHAVRGGDGEIVYYEGTIQDISSKKMAEEAKTKLESQLRQAQKMEAIGTLAGGIAHDFNNILSAIMGYGELAQLAADKGGDSAQHLEQIVKAAERARGLVKQMLTFSRRSETELHPADINDLVNHSVVILERAIPKMVDIQTKLAGDLKLVKADATQIEQVIMNLANNAADAMPDGGRLVFETKMVSLDEDYIENHLEIKPGNYVLLSVTDTGHGMDGKTLEKIFDPFFTTKEIGKGTGLGLSTVFGIVKEHGGHISCYSEPGLGTTFKIHLPTIQASLKDMEAQDQSAQAAPRGDEKLLLVDDEEAIRGFGAEILEEAGYRVSLAASGEEALELYRRMGAEVDLVILDLGMPGMGGHKCIKELLALNPRLKVLIASGYSATGKVADTLEQGATGYIAKPFRRIDLLQTVRQVLDS